MYHPPNKVEAARNNAVGTVTIKDSTLWNLIDTGQTAAYIKVLLYLRLIDGKINPASKFGRGQIAAALGLSDAGVQGAIQKLLEGNLLTITDTSFIEFTE